MAFKPVRFIAILFSGAAILASCALIPGYTSASDVAAENLAIADGYAGLSKYDKAAQYYKKAERVKVYRNAARWGLARSRAMTGDWAAAAELLEGLHRQDSTNRLVSEAYAYALVKNGSTDEGLSLYSSIRASSPDDADAAVNYAEALSLAGKWEDALSAINEIREKFPDADALARLDGIEKKCEEALNPSEPEKTSEHGDKPAGELPPDVTSISEGALPDSVTAPPGDKALLEPDPGLQ